MFASLGMQQKSNNLALKFELSGIQLAVFILVISLNIIVFAVLPGAVIIEAKRFIENTN